MNENILTGMIEEINAYTDMGMHTEAAVLAEKILSSEHLDAAAFSSAMESILLGQAEPEKFKDQVQAAYNRLHKDDQQRVRSEMLGYYFTLHDFKSALPFVYNQTRPADLLFAMEACLKNDRFDMAEKLFADGKDLLTKVQNDFERSMVLTAMAVYCQAAGRLDEAEQFWFRCAEFDEPPLRDALGGLIRIQAVRAWKYLQQGFARIEQFKKNICPDTDLKLPGNHDQLLAEAQKELEAYREALAKIVAEKDLNQFGIKSNENSK